MALRANQEDEFEPNQVFTRQQLLRMFHLRERQLVSWGRQQLVRNADAAEFGIPDLIAIRTLTKLRESKVSPAQIRIAVRELRKKAKGAEDPFVEYRIYAEGNKVRVEAGGAKMDAATGQLLFNFDASEIRRLLAFPGRQDEADVQAHKNHLEAEMLFEQALRMEQDGAPPEDLIDIYQRAVDLDPGSVGALVNLGTIHFNAGDFREAEKKYKKALEVDQEYALAHFNLGNLYDERGDRPRALHHYLAALKANPGYADAHYNLALLYQNTRQPMKAARHWREYLKLDGSSSWAAIARRELDKIKDQTIVPGGAR
jgi:tetratricopeptide (TPR) repeat protein